VNSLAFAKSNLVVLTAHPLKITPLESLVQRAFPAMLSTEPHTARIVLRLTPAEKAALIQAAYPKSLSSYMRGMLKIGV
jgi:uncharacterized protein YfaA (DUF2138 family)